MASPGLSSMGLLQYSIVWESIPWCDVSGSVTIESVYVVEYVADRQPVGGQHIQVEAGVV